MTRPLARAHSFAAGPHRLVLTLAAGVALADASIVTLALPDLETSLGAGVLGVAAVLFVYTAVMAIALPLAARRSTPVVAGAGFALAAAASVVCALAPSLGVLLAARALQAAGGALGLVGVFALVDGGASGRRWWIAASVFGVAVGPALGGALTQALGWPSIFVVQAPIAALAALVMLAHRRGSAVGGGNGAPAPVGGPVAPSAPSAAIADTAQAQRESHVGPVAAPVSPARAHVALALVSASLSAVLFLLVLLVVAGWSKSPLSAAVALTVLPLGALAGALVRGTARARAVVGCALLGSGVLSLAFIPQAHLAWTLPPQALAGVGMGLALTGLSGSLLAERTPREAARLLSVRHAGIALLLVALAPLIAHQLMRSTDQARLRGVAIVLDARLSPQAKLALAPGLLGSVTGDQPRGQLLAALAAARVNFQGAALTEFDRLGRSADDTLLAAVSDAFKGAFLLSGAVALLAALLLALGPPRAAARPARSRSGVRVARAGLLLTGLLVCLITPVAYAADQSALSPAPVPIRDPCLPRALPGVSGLTGALQDQALHGLDAIACRLHTSREEIVLAFVDPAEGRRFAAAHPGYDPSAVTSLFGGLLGSGGLGGLLGPGG